MTKLAPFTKATIRRAIQAAKEQGAAMVEMMPDGRIRVLLREDHEVVAATPSGQTVLSPGADAWGDVEA